MLLNRILTFCIVLILMASCTPTSPPDDTLGGSPGLLELTFEERMAIRARMTTFQSDAKREATLEHDRYESKETAVLFEKRVVKLKEEKQAVLLLEYSLTQNDLELIVEEYLRSRGTKISE